MPRLRYLATLLLLPLTLAVQGGAVAHGLVHEHEAEHAREHREQHGAAQHAGPEVADANHGHDHGHPELGQPIWGRSVAGVVAVLASETPEVPAVRERPIASAAPTARTLLPRGDPSAGPPPRLRAPPAR